MPGRAARDDLRQMGQVADRIVAQGRRASSPTSTWPRRWSWTATTTQMDGCTAAVRDHAGPEWPHGVETAVDITLLGRFYERFADHAVNAGRRVVYLVTGEAFDD